MDPRETLLWLIEAIRAGSHDEASELAEDLADWFFDGGFMPEITINADKSFSIT